MGAWGHEIFDNDSACDWQEKLVASDDLSPIQEAFQRVLEADDYLEVDEASEALAACEVLAHLRGRPGIQEASIDDLAKWANDHKGLPHEQLTPIAQAVLDRIEADDSELKELWEETNDFDKWLATVEDVRRRLVEP